MATGKWARPDVPHAGWQCVSVYDTAPSGDLYRTCAMCEKEHIRFVHIMRHVTTRSRLSADACVPVAWRMTRRLQSTGVAGHATLRPSG